MPPIAELPPMNGKSFSLTCVSLTFPALHEVFHEISQKISLKVVRTQPISFWKSLSVRAGSDKERLWILNEKSFLYRLKID